MSTEAPAVAPPVPPAQSPAAQSLLLQSPPPSPPPIPPGLRGRDAAPGPSVDLRHRRLVPFGIQSKLLVMLLVTSILSALVVGFVGYRSGQDSLENAAFNQMTHVRESRSREITSYFKQLTDAQVIYTRGSTAIDAVQAFTAGFTQLQSATTTPQQDSAVASFYRDTFVPRLERNTGDTSDPAGFLPTTPAQKYLQSHYTATGTNPDDSIKIDDAGDGSAWSAAHAKFHDYFRELVDRFHYDDALLLDTEGNVVYSAYSGADLGTNVETGPYRDSSLATAYKDALTSNAVDFTKITDFERYQPAYGLPTAWAVSPIGSNGVVSGVLALQVPVTAINDLMTGGGDWSAEGLGQTGETYLAGPDETMRSISRLLVEDPQQYQEQAIAAGQDPVTAAQAVATKDTVLLQDTRTPAVQSALRGQSGTAILPDYLGQEALIAYAPLQIEGLRWVIVAKIATAEAFRPVTDFTRNLVLSTAAIIFLVCLASLILAQAFVRPVRRLVNGVRQVAAGDLSVEVMVRTTDEFGDLSGAFNDMSRSLRVKQELLDQQRAENDRLLLTLMPEAVAQRYRKGEATIAEDHQDVSVIFADIVGFEALTEQLSSEKSLALLNDLVLSFDEAGERLGIEKIRTLRTGYLASCGLSVPRVDNSRRAVEFAVEMDTIIRRFNRKSGTYLSLRAGVDTGTVTSGLVGHSSVVYDMWGDAVSLANQLQGVSGRPGIFVTARVYDQTRDILRFEPAGEIENKHGRQSVWRVVTDES